MRQGSSSGAGIVLCLTIMGFIVCLFIFWPLAFAILFVGIAIFCALQSEGRTAPSQPPREGRPLKYEPVTQSQRRSRRETSEQPVYYQVSGKRSSGLRIPIEQSEDKTEEGYQWRKEEPESSTLIRKPILEEETNFSTAKQGTERSVLEEELETIRSKYNTMSTTLEKGEKAESKTPLEKQSAVTEKKVESIKELESEEEANRVILEELKERWMSGKIDLEMYQRLKEKYEKKIKDIQRQKKQT